MDEENSTTLADGCPEPNEYWPETWPAGNVAAAAVITALWFTFMVLSLLALFVRRNHQPLRSRRLWLVGATTVGLSCVFVISSVRELIGREVFPCSAYLIFATLSPAAAITPIVARLLHHKNRVEFQQEFLHTRMKNMADVEAVKRLMHLKFKARSARAYQICAGLFLSSVLIFGAYQQSQPRYYISAACVGCEMTTLDSVLYIGMFLVSAALCMFALRRLAKQTNGTVHREVRDIERALKVLSFGGTTWLIIFRLDPGNLHRSGVLSWAYLLDAFLMYAVVHLVWVPVYESFTNTSNQGKTVSLDVVLATPALHDCFENFLVSEFAVENLRFVEEVRRWKKYFPGQEAGPESLQAWVATGSDIYNTFVHERALLEVNLSGDEKSKLALVFDPTSSTAAAIRAKVKTTNSSASARKLLKSRKPRISLQASNPAIPADKQDTASEDQHSDDEHLARDVTPDVFDEAVEQILKLLEMDSFPRFLASNMYAKIQDDTFPDVAGASATRGTDLSIESAPVSLTHKRSTVDDPSFD